MRAGLSSIQQTLTPDAVSVLNQSIAEARRRNHGQTTPLHVAATLLASPTGYLRQACIRSHPNSSHPLQCRALELCFSVALERLTTAQNAPGMEPPISNALMAALKRAQAHQRRGCPEQQQQPLLAVKVELEQLIISILDDPSVSRVMREASFSSPAVKATIEQSLNSNSPSCSHQNTHHVSFSGITPRIVSNSPQLNPNPIQPTPRPVQLANKPAQLPPPNQFTPRPAQLTPNPLQLNPPGPLGNRNLYLNPRLQQQSQPSLAVAGQRGDEVKKLLEIMNRVKKRNPVLVGDSEPDVVVKELLRKIESKDMMVDEDLKNVEIVSLDKGVFLSERNQIPAKIKELGGLIENRISNGKGVILNLGDLKWLVEQPVNFGSLQPQQQVVSEAGKAAVVEMAELLARFVGAGGVHENNNSRLWLIGTATCETYLRCQVYHSTMENDWDLQAVPIASRSPLPGMFPRMSSLPAPAPAPVLSVTSLKPASGPPLSVIRHETENSDPGQQSTFCLQCSENYDKELARLTAIAKTFSPAKQDESLSSLPQWLQKARLNSNDTKSADQLQVKDQGVLSKQKTEQLHKKWKETCLRLHPNFHSNSRSSRLSPPALSMPSLYNPKLLARPPFQPKLHPAKPFGEALQLNTTLVSSKPLGETLQLNTNIVTTKADESLNGPILNQVATQTAELVASPPLSPVRTDLVLGRKGMEGTPERATEDQAKDFLGRISSEPPQTKLLEKFANALDADTYKKLLRGLMEKAWWQAEAASAVASAITRCNLDNGKRRGGGARGDVWLLFTGPDRVGKRKMASVLADQICAANPIMISLGTRRGDEESDANFRGKTVMDRIAEAVRRNPFAVIMLEDIDEADMIVRGNIKRGIERGRITDSHGREVGLGNTVFILTGDWSTTNPDDYRNGHFVDEKKLASVAGGNWQLGLIVREKNAKRRVNWLENADRATKLRKEMGSGLSLDLNLSTGDNEDARTDGSHSSSDLTIDQDHEEELGLPNQHVCITSVPHDLANNVDDSIVFKPVDAAFVRREIKKTISVKFSMVVDESIPIEVGDDVLEKIMGGLWHDRTSLEQWIENVLAPSFDELKPRLPSGDRTSAVVRLVVESDSVTRSKIQGNADWLPSSIMV